MVGPETDRRRPGGANLRTTAMDRDTLMTVFKCGLPGTSMPFFDQYSYTDDRCYGMTAAQIEQMAERKVMFRAFR